jgi:hypothetical protein
MVGFGDAGGRHDPTQRIGIVNEVLAQGLPRPEIEFLRQIFNFGTRQ